MRMAFGLIGILVTLGVIVWVLSYTLPHQAKALHTAKLAKEDARQIAGYDEDGVNATQSIKIAEESKNGKLTGVLVTSVKAGGAMEKYYGIKRNDSIVEIAMGGGSLTPVKEMSSADEAKDALLTAYQNKQPIVVVRDEKRITLPLPAAKTTGAQTSGSTQTPAGATNTNTSDKDSLQRQLDAIPGVR